MANCCTRPPRLPGLHATAQVEAPSLPLLLPLCLLLWLRLLGPCWPLLLLLMVTMAASVAPARMLPPLAKILPSLALVLPLYSVPSQQHSEPR